MQATVDRVSGGCVTREKGLVDCSTFGGVDITIHGSNFGDYQELGSVRIGGKECIGYKKWSASEIVCGLPANAGVRRFAHTPTRTLYP